jgi:hypothetical protein
MKYTTARKILDDNGIIWDNFLDLDFVLWNMDKESNPTIVNAIHWMQTYLITGRRRQGDETIS